jgi:hypothetical protein
MSRVKDLFLCLEYFRNKLEGCVIVIELDRMR